MNQTSAEPMLGIFTLEDTLVPRLNYLEEITELIDRHGPARVTMALDPFASKLEDECFEQVRIGKFELPNGEVWTAVFIYADAGSDRFIFVPRVATRGPCQLYFEGKVEPQPTKIHEIAHAIHDLLQLELEPAYEGPADKDS